MTGPLTKPLPLSDDDYARQEEERTALEEAPEVVMETPEFLPIATVEVERVEREWTRMEEGSPERRSYDDWGRVS